MTIWREDINDSISLVGLSGRLDQTVTPEIETALLKELEDGNEQLIVDMSESVDMLADLNALAEVCEPGTVVLALGIINDVGIYRDLVNSGIHDYLVKPISQDLLREAVISGEAALHAPAEAEVAVAPTDKSTVVIIGSRGGVGSTTVATNVAVSNNVTLWFRFQTPTSTSSYDEYSSMLTVTTKKNGHNRV